MLLVQDTPCLVKLLSVLVEIFGPTPLFLKNYKKNDEKLDIKSYLEFFNDELLPWCLDGKYSTCNSKIDLLLSLFQDESFFDQWCFIIKCTTAEQKHPLMIRPQTLWDDLNCLRCYFRKSGKELLGES